MPKMPYIYKYLQGYALLEVVHRYAKGAETTNTLVKYIEEAQ